MHASFVHPQCQYFSAAANILLEEGRDALLGVDVEDGLGEEGGDAELRELLVGRPLRRRRDGVEDDALLHLGVGDAVVAGSAEEAVRREGEDALGALGDQDVGGLAEGAGRVDHVVDDDAVAVLDLADEVHLVDGAGAGALLDDHGEADVVHVELVGEALLELLGAVDAAGVGTDDDGVVQVLVAEVVDADDAAVEVVDWDARPEEALDLAAVQIDGDDAVDAHGLEEAGDVGGRDGDPGLHLAVLPGVAVVGDDDGDATGAGAVEGGDHEEELHDVVVDGGAGGLDDVHVLSSDVLVDHDVDLPVGEAADGGLAEVDAQDLGDLEGEAHVAVAAEELEAGGMSLGLGGGGLEAGLLHGHVGDRMRGRGRGGGNVGAVVAFFLALVLVLLLRLLDKSLRVHGGGVDGVDGHGILEVLLAEGHAGGAAQQSGGGGGRRGEGGTSPGAGAIVVIAAATTTCCTGRRSSPGRVGRR